MLPTAKLRDFPLPLQEFEGKHLDVSGLPPGNYVIESDSKNEESYYFEID